LTITNVDRFDSVLLGFSLIAALHRLYPNEFEIEKVIDLMGNAEALKQLRAGESPEKVLRAATRKMREFLSKRQKVLIYDVVPRRKKERQ